MNKNKVMDIITSTGVIAVLRADGAEACERYADAAVKGGIRAVEITMTVPGALGVIERLAAKYGGTDGNAVKSDSIAVGAGTVLDPETARLCILAGARFIVCPALNAETVRLCNRYAAAVIPGVMTVTEALAAMEYGCTVLKLFPSSVYGPAVIRAFKGPLPQADFIPAGGVTSENAAEWIRAGAAAVGTGSDLTGGGDAGLIEKKAAALVEIVRNARAT